MKTIDDHYKDWSGVDRIVNSFPIHDSSDCCDFAEYYHSQFEGNIIKAKSLRKKGTDKWYYYEGGWILKNFPCIRNDWQVIDIGYLIMMYEDMKEISKIVKLLPKDAELIEIEIRMPAGGGEV
jgi:hypothetical protein